ncbi:MAG TPA: uroporphyrinogen decarboxylase family protein [bacterium]|nr:uroporphyrinogen decarboxylase family protein [bacterium]
MNGRDRILTALQHKEPDRVPFDMGSSFVTGITKNAYLNLARYMGIDAGETVFCDTVQQLCEPGERILRQLEVDTRGLVPHVGRKNPDIEAVLGKGKTFTDEWGIKWTMPKDGLYFDLTGSPLSGDITEKDVENFPWPDSTLPSLFENLDEKAQRYYQEGYAVMLESFGSGIFEMSCRIRGYEQFYMDLAMNPSIACAIMDKFLEMKIKFYKAAAEKMGQYIQFVREGDDMGSQESLLISRKMYSDYLKPRHKTLFDAQKKIFSRPFYTFFHSDGAIYELIPDFIEIGADILNPVQVTDKGVTLERLKKEFGRELSFWGGGIDTQHVLPAASPAKVKEDVKKRIEALAPGGGFVFNTIHNIQDDVPPENIAAMHEALMEYGKYY